MSYHIKFSETAKKQLGKFDGFTRSQIIEYVERELNNIDNPRRIGKGLKGKLKGLWRYEIGKYRLLCSIEDDTLIILIVKIGHRREVYRG